MQTRTSSTEMAGVVISSLCLDVERHFLCVLGQVLVFVSVWNVYQDVWVCWVPFPSFYSVDRQRPSITLVYISWSTAAFPGEPFNYKLPYSQQHVKLLGLGKVRSVDCIPRGGGEDGWSNMKGSARGKRIVYTVLHGRMQPQQGTEVKLQTDGRADRINAAFSWSSINMPRVEALWLSLCSVQIIRLHF